MTEDPLIIFVLGVTNTGKSSVMQDSPKYAMDCFKNVGLVQVGKEMRRRYPPTHFNGMGAPDNIELEAIEIFLEQLKQRKQQRCDLILVDGQPRRYSQIDIMLNHAPRRAFLHLTASHEVLLERAAVRDSEDPDKLSLSLARLKNDKIQLYDVLSELSLMQERVLTYDTSKHSQLQTAYAVAQWCGRLR